ncbi:MAG: hypothetical protein L0Y62_02715 [Nitrospirae bacterium]|nr:hypothetical protein [Nitrospirota bacterium]
MAKRLVDILLVIARDIEKKGIDPENALKKISAVDIDFHQANEELLIMEAQQRLDDSELDAIKTLLTYVLIKETELEMDDIYAFVFGKGRRIIWN